MYDCDDVFRLSTEFDFKKSYQYETQLKLQVGTVANLPNNFLLTKSRDRKAKERVTGRIVFSCCPATHHTEGERLC